MPREIRLSPDGDTVAIRSDWPEDHSNAWAIMSAINGGSWAFSSYVEEWQTIAPITE